MKLCLCLSALLLLPMAAAAAVDGPPLVLDGDTIEVAGKVIDLVGIDAPEFGQHCRRGGTSVDCGMIARTQLLDLTAASNVSCVVDDSDSRPGWPAVALCRAGGYDLSEGMAHTGWALPVADRYEPAAAAAKRAGRGLWGFEFVAPSDWRNGTRLDEK